VFGLQCPAVISRCVCVCVCVCVCACVVCVTLCGVTVFTLSYGNTGPEGGCAPLAPQPAGIHVLSSLILQPGALRIPTPTHSATKLAGIHVPSLTNPRNLGRPSAAYESLTRASLGAPQEFM